MLEWARGEGGERYRRVVVGKGIVNVHVFEKPADMGVEEMFDHFVIEFGIYKDGADVCFDDVR